MGTRLNLQKKEELALGINRVIEALCEKALGSNAKISQQVISELAHLEAFANFVVRLRQKRLPENARVLERREVILTKTSDDLRGVSWDLKSLKASESMLLTAEIVLKLAFFDSKGEEQTPTKTAVRKNLLHIGGLGDEEGLEAATAFGKKLLGAFERAKKAEKHSWREIDLGR